MAVLFLTCMESCMSDYAPEAPDSESPASHASTRARDEAIEAADRYMSEIFGQTRASSRTVKNVSFDVTRSTRGDKVTANDTICSIVNYADDSGFVLMTKDTEGYRLYGIADSGNLNLADTVFNQGLSFYMRNLRDRNLLEMDKSIQPFVRMDVIEPKVIVHQPMLNQNVSKWDQHYPYNMYCPMVYAGNGSNEMVHGVTGCVPTALGMMMSYFRWPLSIEGRNLDWNLLAQDLYYYNGSNFAYTEIASLMYLLGKPAYLNTQYGPDNSYSLISNIIPSLKKWGYRVSSNNFSTSSPISYLGDGANRKPVITYGFYQNSNNDTVHVWILDGYLSVINYGPEVYESTTDTYYHCVWGWGGSGNGYYYIGKSTSKTGFKDEDRDEYVTVDHSFINLKYLWDYKPNK